MTPANPPDHSADLRHLATREVSHAKMFMVALQSMNKLAEPRFGDLQPDDTVTISFNMSLDGEANQRGPWTSEPTFRSVAVAPLRQREQEGR